MFGFPGKFRIGILFLALTGISVLSAPKAEAAWIFDANAGVRFDDNATNAATSAGKKGDLLETVALSVGQYYQVEEYTGIALTLDVKDRTSANYAGLNNLSTGLSFQVTRKLGLGREAIRLNVYGSVSNDDYLDIYRSSTLYKAGVSGSRWIGDIVKVGVGYEYDRSIAKNLDTAVCTGAYGGNCVSSDVYGIQGNSGIINAEVIVTERDTLFFSYRLRSGSVTSSDFPTLKALNASSAVSPDGAFNGLYAYRISATTQTGSIGISHELTRKMSLNADYSLYQTMGSGGIDYQGNLFHLIIAYSL